MISDWHGAKRWSRDDEARRLQSSGNAGPEGQPGEAPQTTAGGISSIPERGGGREEGMKGGKEERKKPNQLRNTISTWRKKEELSGEAKLFLVLKPKRKLIKRLV